MIVLFLSALYLPYLTLHHLTFLYFMLHYLYSELPHFTLSYHTIFSR